PESRQQHTGPRSIGSVLLAVEAHQIPFFELQGDEDVGRRRRGEEEVSGGHRRGCPEGEEEAEHEGMADAAVGAEYLEADRGVRAAGSVEVDLSQPEQVEVIDQERGHEHESPTGPEDGKYRRPSDGTLDVPDDGRDRPPLPEEEAEGEA